MNGHQYTYLTGKVNTKVERVGGFVARVPFVSQHRGTEGTEESCGCSVFLCDHGGVLGARTGIGRIGKCRLIGGMADWVGVVDC